MTELAAAASARSPDQDLAYLVNTGVNETSLQTCTGLIGLVLDELGIPADHLSLGDRVHVLNKVLRDIVSSHRQKRLKDSTPNRTPRRVSPARLPPLLNCCDSLTRTRFSQCSTKEISRSRGNS